MQIELLDALLVHREMRQPVAGRDCLPAAGHAHAAVELDLPGKTRKTVLPSVDDGCPVSRGIRRDVTPPISGES